MLQLARETINRVPEVRPRKVAALRRAIRQGTYRVDSAQLRSALLAIAALDPAPLKSRPPALILEQLNL